jgi:hypothetical protein
METELIEKIRLKYRNITHLLEEEKPDKLRSFVNDILKILHELIHQTDNELLKLNYDISFMNLAQTANKKVSSVECSYRETLSVSASNKEICNFKNSLNTTIDQIYNDIAILIS